LTSTEIEGDFDAEHIRISLHDLLLFDQKLKENDLSNTPHLWRPYAVTASQLPGKVEYAPTHSITKAANDV
jgi:hypothetical protein